MSFHEHESAVTDFDRPAKRRIQRRHGACEPCRSSKTKCDGRLPCGACRSERRRQCPCVYSEKAMKLQQVTAEIRRRAESEKRNCDEALKSNTDDGGRRLPTDASGEPGSQPSLTEDTVEAPLTQQAYEQTSSEMNAQNARMSHSVSVCAAVEEFKRLKPARGYSAQVVSRCNGFDVSENPATMRNPNSATQVYLTTASHQPSPYPRDLSKDPVDVQILGNRLQAVDTLIKDGYLSRAWSDLGSVVREAQMIQASINKDHSLSESTGWKQLWHDILDLEAQLGLTLGHPTTLILGKIPRSGAKNDGASLEESLEETKIDLYHHIQGMLGLDLFNPTAIRDFLERARDILQHEPFNQIGLCTTEGHSAAVRDLHLSTHLLFMVVFCRMASLCDLFSRDLTNGSWSETPAAEIIRTANLHQPRQKLAYCRKMFRSANFILESFISLHEDDARQTGRNWIRCHGAYIAAVILGIAKLRHEVEWHGTTEKLKRMEQIFLRLSQAHPHSHLYVTAVNHLRDLNSVKVPASEATRNKHTGIKHRKRSAPGSVPASPIDTDHRVLEDTPTSLSVSPTGTLKRSIDMANQPSTDDSILQDRYAQNNQQQDDDYQSQSANNSSFDDLNLDHLSLFQDNSATYSHSSSSFTNPSDTTSTTSFSEPDIPLQTVADMQITHPGPPFAYPFPYNVFHPPMAWNNPIFTLGNQRATPMALQIPVMPQYASDAPSIPCEVTQQYNLGNHSTSKTPAHDTHGSTTPQVPSEGTTISARLSPAMLSNSGFENAAPGCMGVIGSSAGSQAFLRQVKTPLSTGGPSSRSRRPSFDRKHSSSAIQQPPSSIVHNNQQTSQIDWHAHNMRAHRSNGGMSNSVPRQQGNENSLRHSDLSSRELDQTQCFHQSVANQPPQMLGDPIFPHDQIAYLNPATGMFEQPQLHGHYPQGHVPTYQNHYVQDADQLQDQWRRMSIDASGAARPPL